LFLGMSITLLEALKHDVFQFYCLETTLEHACA
jgi:hypothetical protein